MNEAIICFIEKYPSDIIKLHNKLRALIYDSVSETIDERLWAKIPSYYVGESFVRLILFKDHINIEAKAINQHKDELTDYKLTQKGMLQLKPDQEIPFKLLLTIFKETLQI